LPIDVEALKAEREDMRSALRELEAEQRKLEVSQKKLRQKEIQTKRTIEALDVLIDLQEPPQDSSAATASS